MSKICIQWFPGHMKKTFKEISQYLKIIDLILVILDARIPYSSVNWELLKTFNNKPFLLLLNKISLADMSNINIFKKFFENHKIPFLWIDSKIKINIHQIKPYIYRILKMKNPFWKHKILKLMITGMPNVGKSTFINCLANKKMVKTANIPGITKQMQWIKIGPRMKLLDTPGILYHKFNDPRIGYNLAICGCIKSTLYPKLPIVEYLLTYLKKNYYQNLQKCFKLNEQELELPNLWYKIAQKNLYLTKNKILDENKVLDMILYKISNGFIGPVNFDLHLSHDFVKEV
ncbi:ribosome biogenesis GTPase YlqF [Candidatus Phytoplasma bonamiae]|uniref:Ribosome biogenesis GTPase A n=1 Tax=Candidatus Phytoplasma bonamiae TaxID=2982626 RepID=A0ABT9D5H4_9MOLU|nr:ribosome biogenesis GTPase YlqF ['Bonamia sp.' little leaf phytoplasma]MDO8064212.1 ribosome biogenesis GTPase YlqF ['Bonamia sp.' little leaf phytoplasma]MDV3174766.1 ribosome biogenesis GTPase YlqF ['Bonamia sp.' little leaf phytoplasma]